MERLGVAVITAVNDEEAIGKIDQVVITVLR